MQVVTAKMALEPERNPFINWRSNVNPLFVNIFAFVSSAKVMIQGGKLKSPKARHI